MIYVDMYAYMYIWCLNIMTALSEINRNDAEY